MAYTTKMFYQKTTVTNAILPLTTLFSFTGKGMLKTMFLYPQNYNNSILRVSFDGNVVYDGDMFRFQLVFGLPTGGQSGSVNTVSSYNLPFKSSIKFEYYSNLAVTGYAHECGAVIVHE